MPKRTALSETKSTIEVNSKNDYPILGKTLALIILILNIFFPGLGTMIMGCSSESCGKWFCYGLLQSLLAPLIIGWIWAICTGIKCHKLAK